VRADIGEGARFQGAKICWFGDFGPRSTIGPDGVMRADIGGGARFQERKTSLVCQILDARAWLVNGRIVLVA
jgi:hypothetical protein